MRNPDDEGFITLHRGRQPILQRVAMVLLLACVWVFFWKVTKAHDGEIPKMDERGYISSGVVSTGALSSATTILRGNCAANRVPVIVGVDMMQPCMGPVCPLVVYKCAIPADLTDQE